MAKFYKKPKFIFLILILVVIASFFFASRLSNSKNKISNISSASNIQLFPTKVPLESTSEVHSPDGKMKVVAGKVNKTGGNLYTYTFTVSDLNGNSPKVIFTTTLSDSQKMQVPENSFSPDNKYLFLKEDDGASLSFLVFKASGEKFAKGEDYIDVVPLFTGKKDLKITDITGWDADTLLHIFTASDKGRGPSYWFDLDSRSFLELGTR